MAFKITELCKKYLRESSSNIIGPELVYNLKLIAPNLNQTFPKMTHKRHLW